ncbi:sigma-54-dependent Fis family transcriptional regulator [Pseudothauera rhizosphaerae]|uniref:AAA family ATPase n=1 Tax=Pseudothauera rhizosphaerae TaxID=2565932 RepID=A0A4V3WAR9_9RHOO|nr:sigma-54-dependent Fis family transcriptional regulator [Pseudothauera rhizosphaerae]THF60361.1 AAA family ATPase [Pseudothauera rhizosphaerae]
MSTKPREHSARPTPTIVGDVPLPLTPEILKRLHFNPAEGLIWLEDRRMVLMHAEAMGALRQELIESLGSEAARGLLTRFGYAAGCRDGQLALKIHTGYEAIQNLLVSGAQFHALQGIVTVEQVHADIDVERGTCEVEFLWRNCFEDQIHIAAYGIGSEPVCWMEVGYASGFLTTCMGKRILVREVACRAMGDDTCRCVAKPVEDWENVENDLKYFEPGPVLLRPHRVESPVSAAVGAAAPMGTAMSGPGRGPPCQEVIGASVPFNVILHKIRRVAPTNATVLLLGESGVGKSAFAREVQRQSRRAGAPFLEVNCAAIPEQLMEAELFGVERGAYTGAGEARPGRFQVADGGTLFLDEIGTLSMTAQGKLLRVIQTGEFEPLGGAATRKVDVRIVAATNEELRDAVREGRFREDLFYRLNVFPILIPPLRERREDIPLLLERLIRRYGALHGRRVTGVTAQALQLILNYRWPGNIRELENVIERGVILGEDDQPLGYSHLFTIDSEARGRGVIGLNELGLLAEQTIPTGALAGSEAHAGIEADVLNAWADGVVKRAAVTLDDVENSLVRAAFGAAGGNMSKAATLLGITRAQLVYRVRKIIRTDDASPHAELETET